MTNFERFKGILFEFISKQAEFGLSCVGPWRWYPEYERAKEDLNKWLDNLDIRSVSVMVPELISKGCKLPKYLKSGSYTIEYTNKGLDLVPKKHYCECYDPS